MLPFLAALFVAQVPVTATLSTNPDAILDLMSSSGVAAVKGTWRVARGEVLEVAHRDPGPDKRASGSPNRTHDVAPEAFARDFDDSAWEAVTPESLEERRGSGKLSFEWYRLRLTLPERVGETAVAGATVVFEVVVDDLAEVWVDGRLPQVLGSRGGALPAGWNAPNRVLLTRDARPGQTIQLALFAANGPLSNPPDNFVWIRSATLDVYSPEHLSQRAEVPLVVERLDPALDAAVPPGTRLEHIAQGFRFTEGPVWVNDPMNGSFLLFSDPNANVIHRWSPNELEPLSIYRTKSGYKGEDIGLYGQPGSNGLALDAEGRLSVCEHGNRRVTRLEKNGSLTVLADRFEGKRLNSPNDLAYRSDGALFFTDPPFGLPRFHADPRRELDFSGVFCLIGGELKLVGRELSGPNGLAFSPDERFLYVANWDEARKVVMRYETRPDGTLAEGEVLFDMGAAPEPEALDGLKVDGAGHLFVSGPGGIWVLSPAGKHLGTLRGPELAANMAWGDDDGRTLYWTARTGLYRMRLQGPPRAARSEG